MLLVGSEFGLIPWIAQSLGFSTGWIAVNQHYVGAGIVLLALGACALLVWRRARRPETMVVPEGVGRVAAFFDVVVEWLIGLIEGIIGPHARRHLPLLGTLFLYILFSNLLGLIPGMNPPTGNFNTNLAIAAVVFIYYNVAGIRAHGVANYLKHFMGPVIWIAPLLFGIELISHIVRPFSLSIRLFGNMTADHAVLSVFTDLTKLIVPVVFLGLGVFVSLVQAFVFTLLSAVYIGLAEAHGEEH